MLDGRITVVDGRGACKNTRYARSHKEFFTILKKNFEYVTSVFCPCRVCALRAVCVIFKSRLTHL